MTALTYAEIETAAGRIGDRIRRVVVARADPDLVSVGDGGGSCEVYLALEFMQHTGTFKARGALNFIRAHGEAGGLPEAGVTIASGGNAGLACAWAARDQGVPATVFVPATAPPVKVLRLGSYGADVRLVGFGVRRGAGRLRGVRRHERRPDVPCLRSPPDRRGSRNAPRRAPAEKVCIVLCGANTDPADLGSLPSTQKR